MTEHMYQVVLLLRKPESRGFRATEVYYGKMIPTMQCRGDTLELAKFIDYPRMAVVRWAWDHDTRRKVEDSAVVVDVIGRIDDLSELSDLGDVTWKGLRLWPFPARSGIVTFPNVEEERSGDLS